MAIQFNAINNAIGGTFTKAYAKVDRITLFDNRLDVTVAIFADATARTGNKQPIDNMMFQYTYDPSVTTAEIMKHCYALISKESVFTKGLAV